jgi:hypothetical protein
MLEAILVGMIVAAAAGYAAWSITPAMTRRNLAARPAHALGGPGAGGIAGKAAAALQKLANAPAGGCAECPAATLTPAERADKAASERDAPPEPPAGDRSKKTS